MADRVRKNQASLTAAERQKFVLAVLALKASGVWNTYVNWHISAGHSAHQHPGFLPWHREYLRRLELDLQAVDPDVTLPYWDWTVDNSPSSSIWAADFMGGNGRPSDNKVMDGPFAHDAGAWNCVASTPYLRRIFGGGSPSLPTAAHVSACMAITPYDSANWDRFSNPSFRNTLEGWIGPGAIHNRVHLWVDGHMRLGNSPDDPVFFLHHCNVDRLWAEWQKAHPGEPYVPSSGAHPGHNLNDPMQPWGGATTVASTLDHRALGYCYDTEPDCPGVKKIEVKEGKIEIKEAKFEKLERKEAKREKIEIKEIKEGKREKSEIKEAKIEKNEIKERKLEKLEGKEGIREKTWREGRKELVENKLQEKLQDAIDPERFERVRPGPLTGGGGHGGHVHPSAAAGGGDVSDRLGRIEDAVSELLHFIGGDLRPELGGGALGNEADAAELAALSQALEKQAADAKQAKDNKDVEKLGEH